MNSQSLNTAPLDPDRRTRDALVEIVNFTPESIAKIHEQMLHSAQSFCDTALHLGLVTIEDVQEAAVRARGGHRAEESSLVEAAILRVAPDRRIVVRRGEAVKPGSKLILAHDQDNPRSERIRVLRTELLLLNEGSRNANVVAVLSPCAGEGRSQLCAELALSFSQLGRRTLLVDADLRRPQQHILFESTNDYGLSQAIAHNDKPYFHPVLGSPQMDLLTAGTIPPNPLELLSDGRFANFVSEWRKSYDFIVLDTPPVTQCSDGLAIATIAGRVLVMSRAQSTSYKSTREMLRRLATTRSRILGAVLNHF